MDLGATDEQLDSPMVFCSGRSGTASYSPDVPGTDLKPLFETILEYVKCPEGDPEAPFQMLCSSVDYNDFVGRIGIGRIQNGSVKVNQDVQVCDWHDQDINFKGRITKLYDFRANGREPVDEARAGDIVAFSGITDVTIGNTLCDPAQVKPPALPQDQRPYRRDDLFGKRQPLRRARGQVCHQPPDPRPAAA